MYDPRLGRWMSIDPEFKQYPFMSPFSAFGNNPLYFVDPGGETLRVAGDAKVREATRALLQKLTNDKVIIQKDGLVKVISSNQNPGMKLTHGTNLIKEIIADNNTTTIKNAPFESSTETVKEFNSPTFISDPDKSNGVGSDNYVNLGVFMPELLVQDKTGKTIKEKPKRHIALAHELLHALKNMKGETSKKAEYTVTYKDTDGKLKQEGTSVDEVETTGLEGIKKKNYSTENDIRKEQKENKRIKY